MVKKNKPYIKKYGVAKDFVVWIVDGRHIRANMDEEFTNFGQHYMFNFIPKNEFWIDKKYGDESEIKYFIDHMYTEFVLMREGKSSSLALRKANAVEREERKKERPRLKKCLGYVNQIHKKKLKRYETKKVKVWIVNGKLVRDFFFIDFTEGGHDLIYPFVPKNEIWIDDDLSPQERKFVLLHELHERNLMSEDLGSGYAEKRTWKEFKNIYNTVYATAHRAASRLEKHYRHNPKEIYSKIREEIRNFKKL